MLRNPGLRKSVEQPVLDLNFAAAQIGSNAAPDSRIDFSRGNNAWFVDSDGLVKKSPHNLLLQSEDFGTSWTANGDTTVATNEIVAPDGTTTADKISSANFGSGVNHIRQQVNLPSGTINMSVFVKDGGLGAIKLRTITFSPSILDISSDFTFSSESWTSLNASHTNAFVENYGNGWYRIGFDVNNPATGNVQMRLSANTGNGFIYLWGAQVSQHTTLPVDNPYLKTTGSAVYAARLDHDPTWFMSAAQEQNLFPNTDLDDGNFWGLGRSTVVEQSSVQNPFGGTDGVYLNLETSVGGASYIYLFGGTNWQQYVTEGKQYTLSIYAKQFNGQKVTLRSPNDDFRPATFNLETVSIENQDSLLDNATIEDVGNGWFRCSIVDTISAFESGNWIVAYLENDFASPDYGLYYYGLQLEVGSTASTYHRTTGAPYYGEGATPKGLLIEEQRANIAPNSEQFTVSNGVTLSADAYLAPDGTTTADGFTISSANEEHKVGWQGFGNSLVTIGTVHAVSFFAKLINGTPNLGVRGFGKGTSGTHPIFDLSAGTVVNVGSAWESGTSIEDFGNGWFRCKCIVNPSAQFTPILQMLESGDTSGTHTYTGNGTDEIAICGGQAEIGSFVTSYIQTTGTSLTRNADVAVMGPTTGGTELVSDPAFDSGVGQWIATTNATVSHDASNLNVEVAAAAATGTNLARYSVSADGATVVEGRRYRLSLDVTRDAGACNYFFKVHDDNSFTTELGASSTASGSSASLSADCTANSSGELLISFIRSGTLSSSDAFSLDNLSVRELYPFEQYNPAEGTLFVEATQTGEGISNFASVAAIVQEGGVNADVLNIYRHASTDRINFQVKAGGVDQAGLGFTEARALGTAYKFAASYLENSISASLDGIERVDDTSATLPAVDQILFYGAVNFQSNEHSGYIKRFRYYKRKLDKVTLQSLTSD